MNTPQQVHSLGRLVDLREREVDRLTAELAAKQVVRQRYLGNLERLEQLRDGSGPSGALPLALSMNCAAYKQTVMQLVAAHRDDLAVHEADMALSQQALNAAACRHEVLNQVHEKRLRHLQQAQDLSEQKRQDELATQVWLRQRR